MAMGISSQFQGKTAACSFNLELCGSLFLFTASCPKFLWLFPRTPVSQMLDSPSLSLKFFLYFRALCLFLYPKKLSSVSVD